MFLMALIGMSLACVALLGWLMLLTMGISRFRNNGGGRVLIGIGSGWGLLVLGWLGWGLLGASEGESQMALGGSALASIVLLGWLVPLVKGVRRRHRGNGGRVLIGVGTAWGVLTLAGLGWGAYMIHSLSSRYEMKAFDVATHQGATGTVAFAYGENGEVKFILSEGRKNQYWKTAVTNGVAVLPTGEINVGDVSFSLTNATGDVLGELSCSPAHGVSQFKLEPGGRHEITGGFPLTASVQAESRGDGRFSLDFSLLDTAGNQISWSGAGSGRRDAPSFEAVSPDGTCFWRDRFEYG